MCGCLCIIQVGHAAGDLKLLLGHTLSALLTLSVLLLDLLGTTRSSQEAMSSPVSFRDAYFLPSSIDSCTIKSGCRRSHCKSNQQRQDKTFKAHLQYHILQQVRMCRLPCGRVDNFDPDVCATSGPEWVFLQILGSKVHRVWTALVGILAAQGASRVEASQISAIQRTLASTTMQPCRA